MLDRVKFVVLHSFAHVFLYLIPRAVHAVLVKLPVTLWQLFTGRRPLTYSSRKERHISVITSATDPAASERLLKTFGLSKDMVYRGPLYNKHIHTILGLLGVSRRVTYERELPLGFDGNPICLEWQRVPAGVEAKGVVLVVPGVGNYGQTPYVQRLVRCAVAKGFHICVLVPRGMGSAPLTQPRLTCITFTQDLRTVLQQCLTREQLRKRFGQELPVFLLGYSAGGSTILKAAVEEFNVYKADPSVYPGGFPLTALVSMNAPLNMFVHASTMERCPFFYQRPMVDAMQKYALKHANLFIKGMPGMPPIKDKAELKEMLKKFVIATDFNEYLVAPHFGYTEGSAGYYKDAAAFKWLEQMDASIPVVCLAARGDPITGDSHTVAEWQALVDAHPNVVYVETPVGGHLSYLASPLDDVRGRGEFLVDFPLHALQHAVRAAKAKTA
ncbi:Alpha/beta hydrolase family [Novymonas esmeraldas]|uniref:Alpha/beta hydrolase family n=1 Tax=Novymonas esmeraldas TaxID=1808958 RepID=A0AAW0EVE8_9TRYP